MAGNAADIAFGMLRVDRIHVLRSARMASQATRIDLFRGMLFKNKNFRLVAAARNVSGSGPMASLATLFRGTSMRVPHCFPWRRLLVVVKEILVARFARLRDHLI